MTDVWISQARCRTRGVPTDVFFPEDNDGMKVALRHCQRCPSQGDCLIECMGDNGEGVVATTLSTRRVVRSLYNRGLVDQEWALAFIRGRNEGLILGRGRSTRLDTHRRHDDEWVREIRECSDTFDVGQSAIAALYSISVQEAIDILNGSLRPEAGGPLRNPASGAESETVTI